MNFEKEYYEQKSIWEQELLPYQIEIIEVIKKTIPTDVKTILDAGCGNGVISNELMDIYDITAVDISETALKYVKTTKKQIASVDNLPFGDASFDLVMVNDVLEHLDDETFSKALKEIQRVSKKYIILTSPFLEGLKFNFTKCYNCKREFHINYHKRSFEFGQIRNIFNDFGLKMLTFCGRLYQSTLSSFVEERHKIDEYVLDSNAVCPFCGSKNSGEKRPHKSIESKMIDAKEFIFLQKNRDLWVKRPDRQEFVGLYERGYKPSEDSETGSDLDYIKKTGTNEILFLSALKVNEIKPFYPFPQYQILVSEFAYEEDLLRLESKSYQDVLKFSFPHIVRRGSTLNVEVISDSESFVGLSAYDSFLDRFRSLRDFKIGNGKSVLRVNVDYSLFPSLYGSLFQLSLSGSLKIKGISIDGGESVYEYEIIKPVNNLIERDYMGVKLVLFCEDKEIKPIWFFEEIKSLSRDELLKELFVAKDLSCTRDVFYLLADSAASLKNELDELIIRLEDTERKRRKCEDVYSQSLNEINILKEAVIQKEILRVRAEEVANKYLEDLKQLEKRYNRLNESLNEIEKLRQRAEDLYRESLEENKRLILLLEQKEAERVKAEEVANKYFSELKSLEERYNTLNNELNRTEVLRDKAERAYNDALMEVRNLKNLLEQKEEERRKAEEVAEKYLEDLKILEKRYNELNDRLNQTEELRQKAENLYQDALSEIKVLNELIEEKEYERNNAEQLYQESLSEIKRLKELIEHKEVERARAEEVAEKYLEDLKVIENRYNELNDKLNYTEDMRNQAESAYQSALKEIKSLNNLLEQKDRERVSAEEIAERYLKELKEFDEKYRELSERLNTKEEEIIRIENVYNDLLKEFNLLKENYGQSLKSIDDLKDEIDELEDKLVKLNNEIDRLINENKVISRERDEYKKSFEVLKSRKVRRLLVLSHMFPHRDQLVFGPFVLDQVKALIRYTDLDVRVISCRPFWMNTYNPLKLKEANRIYWEEVKRVKWEEWDGVKVMYPPYRVGGPFRFITHWHTYSQAVMSVINDVLRDFRFDMVHAHTAYIDGNAAKLIYERYRIPYIITEHMAPYSDYVRNPIVLNKSIESSRSALRILCVSPKFRDEIASFMPEDVKPKLVSYGNGVYTDKFYPVSEKNILKNPARLSFVGSLDERKNPLLMLKVFKRLRNAGLNVFLNILGKGPFLDKMKGFVADNSLTDYVFFSHSLPSEEYAKFFREKTDILVHPSKSEGFGVVIIEALSSGKPVVATRCGGPEYIINDERLGRLVDVDDEDELYDAIVDVIKNYESFDPIWMHNNIKERFGFENFAKRLREMYEEVLRDL